MSFRDEYTSPRWEGEYNRDKVCFHCCKRRSAHLDDAKCLFDSSSFSPMSYDEFISHSAKSIHQSILNAHTHSTPVGTGALLPAEVTVKMPDPISFVQLSFKVPK